MPPFETLEFSINGVDTRVLVTGQGHPVIYLHGASTLEGFGFAHGLADHLRVFCPSHPGMGLSGDAPHIADMSDMLLHYLDLIDALALDRPPHLIGFSMGGWMAGELAGIARERFARVVLVAPAGLADPAFPPADLASIAPQDFPAFMAHDARVARDFFPSPHDVPACAAFGAARAREADVVARLSTAFGMRHPNLRSFLRRIANPALIIWGSEDRLLPAGQGALWQAAMPDAHLMTVPGAGHLIMQEKPEILMHISDFLTR